MKDAEVDMSTGWNGRFDNAKKMVPKLDILLIRPCSTMIALQPKEAPNKEVAMRFLAEVSKPQYRGQFTFLYHLRSNQP